MWRTGLNLLGCCPGFSVLSLFIQGILPQSSRNAVIELEGLFQTLETAVLVSTHSYAYL